MEKKKALRIGGRLSAAVLLLLTACGAKPNIKFEMANCGDVRALELGPGDTVDLTDVDPRINFQIDDNGKVIPPPNENFGVIDPGQRWWFGNREKPYYLVGDQGDPNGNGLTDIRIEKVCPVQPTLTPTGLLKGNVRSVVQADRGFHPGKTLSSKPVRNFPIYRRG